MGAESRNSLKSNMRNVMVRVRMINSYLTKMIVLCMYRVYTQNAEYGIDKTRS